ncbi:MAG: DUF6510 family protein [Candidatus Dormibacteraceae bacterium]
MDPAEARLDGNAVGGLLREIFTMEMTTAETTCGGCGAVNELGGVIVYMHAPGVVLRCPACQQVLMRIVRARGSYWVDLGGTRTIHFVDPGYSK